MRSRGLNFGLSVLIILWLITPLEVSARGVDAHDDGGFQNRHYGTENYGSQGNYGQGTSNNNQYERQQEIYKERGYRYDTRYNHNHYYPPRGYAFRTLPRYYRRIPYRGVDYYFYSGIWYRHIGSSYNVVVPPVGIVVPLLPPYYTTVWVGATPYYYADNAYYAWRPAVSGYEVVEAPDDNSVVQESSIPQELFVYPKSGQSQEQIAKDRYECYRWSVDKTGFDPTQPGGNVSADQNDSKRADYQRAMTACLEGRNYSVK